MDSVKDEIKAIEVYSQLLGVKFTHSVIKVLVILIQHVVLWFDSTSVL